MNKLSSVIGVALLCVGANLLLGETAALAQSQSFRWYVPYDGLSEIGTGVAVSGRTLAIGAPGNGPYKDPNPESGQFELLWSGLVRVFTADPQRTQWTFSVELHAEDASPANSEFGKALAMEGHRLVVATNSTLRIYAKRQGAYELVDRVVFTDATIPPSTPIQFVGDVLALKVQEDAGPITVRIFRIDERGKARLVTALLPPRNRGEGYGLGGMSLDADARTLAVGQMGERGRVYLYERRGEKWTLKETVIAPSTDATDFASGVALRGRRLVVGAPGEDQKYDGESNSIVYAGAVYVYHRERGGWIEVQRLATNDQSQPTTHGLVAFGDKVVTSGRFVWITAPRANDLHSTVIPTGPASLYAWKDGQLEFIARGPNSLARGGIDMSARYVIEGGIEEGFVLLDGAHVVDLRTLIPKNADAEDVATEE